MEENLVRIVIPIYHDILTYNEKISLAQCLKILRRYPISVVKPRNIVISETLENEQIDVIDFEDCWFESVSSYNDLMLEPMFYERFRDYKYILIYQLDAFVFKDELCSFCELNYDYIGAPWLYGQFVYQAEKSGCFYVGNGGLSLRRVQAHLDILKKNRPQNIQEDVFFASQDSECFKVAPVEVALRFSFETRVRECYEKSGKNIPFGCHAWQKYDFAFWKAIFEEYGYDITGIVDGKLDFERNDKLINYSKVDAEKVRRVLKKHISTFQNEAWIWGAGKRGKECGWLLKESDVVIRGYVDGNEALHGERLYNVTIHKVQAMLEDLRRVPVIVAMDNVSEETIMKLKQYKMVEGQNFVLWNVLRENFDK